MKTRLQTVIALGMITIAALAVAQEVRREFRADMTGNGKGKAVWKVRDTSGEFQAELQAEGERLSPNSTFTLRLGTNAPFTVTTNGFGAYRLSRRYKSLERPSIVAGDDAILTNSNGVVVQTGFFQPR